MSEWADAYRVLGDTAAQKGPWRTDRVPFLREVMDTISGRDYQDITLVKSSQSGGTEAAVLNACGYYMDQDPSTILVIQPNVKPMAESFSKFRVASMIRDCSRLAGKVKDPRSRDSGNTILQKSYPGGALFIMGANSPAGLASNPIRVVLADELDRWPASAGTEGDPLSLAEARQITYRHRKKMVKVSSPGNEGESRIEKEWKLSDQRHFYVPCPHCGHEQPLEWRDSGGKPDIRPGRGEYRLIWEKDRVGDDVTHKPETAVYVCRDRDCGCAIEETHKPAMIAAGRWIKHNPTSKRAGFHVSGLLSPWVRWSDIATKWLAVRHDSEQRKSFYNTMLGLLYVGDGEDFNAAELTSRRETYNAEVPKGVGVLTGFIDVQGDRIELEVRGWGHKEESWLVRLERFYGDPEHEDVWDRARAALLKDWHHEGGATMNIAACFVDSGYKQDVAFRFVKSLPGLAFASKGVDHAKAPLSKAAKANRDGVKVFTVNPTTFKDVLFSRLARKVPGAGYMHFGTEAQTGADDAFFLQYAAEKRLVEFVRNQPVVKYINPGKKRNEAIDHYVGNLAALRSRGAIVRERLGDMAKEIQDEGAAKQAAEQASAQATERGESVPQTPDPDDDDSVIGLRRRARGWSPR